MHARVFILQTSETDHGAANLPESVAVFPHRREVIRVAVKKAKKKAAKKAVKKVAKKAAKKKK
ncbi:MAG TPA: hypothetical protein PLT00_11035 [Verrucomicrobiota bacterium]|nr:hypothetical protein [Verrucomicrobiota bacterium]HPY30860.1 hypothetical protein [Verrucomicrobiota bacterium]HQB17234.1 hypothetical protein [Verrucomicrobiota bacterium]